MAGPLIAAAVILPIDLDRPTGFHATPLGQIRDSKMLTAKMREEICPCVQDAAVCWGIGVVEVEEIDAMGISAANRLAMERAVWSLPKQPDALLLDAMTIEIGLPQVGLIDGDAKCFSIAAASIIAKVTRDRFMRQCHESDPRYDFSIHKGYCTPGHLERLAKHGPSEIHRRSFSPVALLAESGPF
jgi:ribonuclease HII